MSTSQPANGTPQVLVADDNRDCADSLALLICLWGYRPLVAYDGPSALALYATHRPGVVLLDIVMPGVDGCEVARRIRKNYPGDDALIIAITGQARGEERTRCAEAGVDLHLAKPADPDELRELLDGELGGPADPARFPAGESPTGLPTVPRAACDAAGARGV